MAKSIKQEDLRKLMRSVKSAKGVPNERESKLRKYKLGARELQLLEEQKAREREDKEARETRKRKAQLPPGFLDAKPKKGILKNSSKQLPPPPPPPPVQVPATTKQSIKAAPLEEERPVEDAVKTQTDEDLPTEDSKLPEGFFDDPKKDAKVRGNMINFVNISGVTNYIFGFKARNQEYKDPAEEEWERFQKEIAAEIDSAQEIVTEEQQESTTERQIEEVEEQLIALSR